MRELAGTTFGKWTVISFSHRVGGAYLWNCRCVCGEERPVKSDSLKSGKSASCGCIPKVSNGCLRHGHSANGDISPEYQTWAAMRSRCLNATSTSYENYGGRGIKVCARWNMFENFLADMGPRPSDKHSIERDDTNGDYTPDNCRWATKLEQANNTRKNRFVEINGIRQTVAQWSRQTGVSQQLIYQRRRLGWSATESILTPPNSKITGRPA